MKFQNEEEPMKALILYDAEHFEMEELFTSGDGNSEKKLVMTARDDAGKHATLTLPD
jgi:hypothetical protein